MASNSYKVQGITERIKFTSRASIKVGDKYYTIEASEERFIPPSLELGEADLKKEREALWDTVNTECDKQIEDIINMYA